MNSNHVSLPRIQVNKNPQNKDILFIVKTNKELPRIIIPKTREITKSYSIYSYFDKNLLIYKQKKRRYSKINDKYYYQKFNEYNMINITGKKYDLVDVVCAHYLIKMEENRLT